jgi:hypothetical protein
VTDEVQRPPDDSSITDETRLLRAIPPEQVSDDGSRPKAGAFQDVTDGRGRRGMSIFFEDLLEEMGLSPEAILELFPGYAIAAITAADARSEDLGVVKAPENHGVMTAHGHVVPPAGGKFSGGQKKRLSRKWQPVIWPGSSVEERLRTQDQRR